MEFLQRHLPRVYQAVQEALNFFTNFTAQIFGAPPDAPQPRNARSNVPIQTPQEHGGPPEEEEVCGHKEAKLSNAKEEDGDGAKGHAGDKDNQTLDLRHRKSDPGGRRDSEHKTEATESKKLGNIVSSSQDIQSILNQEQLANPPEQLKLKNEVVVPCEIKVSQYEEDELMPNTEQYLEYKVYKDVQPVREPSSDDHQHEKRVFQPLSLKSLSFEDEKQLVAITGQERPAEEKMKCAIKLSTETEEYTIDTEHETQVLVDSIESVVTMECDSDNILEVIEINKKLVTPVDETEVPFYSQSGDSRKTLEDLLETANRLAKHCDSVHNIEDQKGSDNIRDLDEMPGSIPELILSKEQGFTEEVLTSVDEILAKRTLLTESRDHQPTNLQEETTQEELLVLKQSGFPGEGNRDSAVEGGEMSTMDKNVPGEATNKEEVQKISEEKHQSKESESQPKMSKKQRSKKRVHFSPSTEDLFKKSERSSRSTFRTAGDDILENELNSSRDNPEQLGSSYIIRDLDLYPNKEDEMDYFGVTTSRDDDGQSTSEEEQTSVIDEGRAVWYDDYSAHGEHDERCESLGDEITQQRQVNFKMDSFVADTERRSTNEHLDQMLFREEMSSVETESDGNIITSKCEHKELFSEESHETVNNSEKSKEDIFLEETKGQVDDLLEERTDLLEYDKTYVNVDDTSQSKNKLETDEQKQTDALSLEQAIHGQNYPETSSTEYYKSEEEFTVDQFSLRETDKNLKSDHLKTEFQEIFSSEDVLKSSEEEAGSSIVQSEYTLLESGNSNQEQRGGLLYGEHIEVIGESEALNETEHHKETKINQNYDFQQKTSTPEMEEHQEHTHYKPSYVFQHEDFPKEGESEPQNETEEPQEPTNDNANYDFQHEDIPPEGEGESLNETATSEMEEEQEHTHHKPSYDLQHEDFQLEEEGEPLNETATSEMEEQQEHTHHKPSYDFQHEDIPQEGESKPLNETATSEMEEEQEHTHHKPSYDLQHEDFQLEEEGEPLKETATSEMEEQQEHTHHKQSYDFQHEDIPPEGESKPLNETATSEIEEQQEHTHDSPNYDFNHEDFPPERECESHEETVIHELEEQQKQTKNEPNHDFQRDVSPLETYESQEVDSQCKVDHIRVELLTEQHLVAEEQYVAGTEGLGNEQIQDDKSQEKLVLTDGNEECHETSYETDQSISVNEVRTSFSQDVLIREGLVSEECIEILKDPNFKMHSESCNKKCEVREQTVMKQNYDYIHKDVQLDIRESEEEGLKVSNRDTEVQKLHEEQLLGAHDEDPTVDMSCKGKFQEDQGQPVFSDDVYHREICATEQSTSEVEGSSTIVEDNLKKEVSEEFNDIFEEENVRAESETLYETMTHEILKHNDDNIQEHLQPDATALSVEDIKATISHIEEESVTEEPLPDKAFPHEGYRNDRAREDQILSQHISVESDDARLNKLHETELNLLAAEVRTSISEEVLTEDSLISEKDIDVFGKVSLTTECKPNSETLTFEPQEHSDGKPNDYIFDDVLIKTRADGELNIGHLEVGHLTEEQLVADIQFRRDEETYTIEGSNSHHLKEDILPTQPVFRDIGNGSSEKLHEIEQSPFLNEICTSIVEDVLIREVLTSDESREVFIEPDREQNIVNDERFTCEMDELQDLTAEEQDNNHTTEVSMTVTNKSQEDESQVKTSHIEMEHVTEGQFVAEEPFEISNEDSPLNRSSTGDHFQEDKLHEEPDLRGSEEIFHNKLTEREQSSSNKIGRLEEDFLKEEHFVDEQQLVVDDEHTTEDSLTVTNKSQDDESDVKAAHIELEHITEGQLVAEGPFEISNEDSPINQSSTGDHFQEDKLHEEPNLRGSDEILHNELADREQSSSNKTGHIEEDFLKEEHFVAEQKLVVDDDHATEDSLRLSNKSEDDESQVKTAHIEMEHVTEEQLVAEEPFEISNEDSPIKRSSTGDHFQEDKLHEEPDLRDSDEIFHNELLETEQSSLNKTGHIEEEFLKGEHFVAEQKLVVDDEHTTEDSLAETNKSQDNESDVKAAHVEMEYVTEGHFVAEELFKITNEVSPINRSSTGDQFQEDKLHEEPNSRDSDKIFHNKLLETEQSSLNKTGHIEEEFLKREHFVAEQKLVVHDEGSAMEGSCFDQPEDKLHGQPVSRGSNEASHLELYAAEESPSMDAMCTSVVEDILVKGDLVSEEFSGVFKDADATLESQSCNETIICEVQEHLEFHLDSQECIGSTADHIQDKMLPIEQFVVTDEDSSEKGSSQNKGEEGTLRVQPASNESNEMQHASLIEVCPSNNVHEAGPEEGSNQEHLLVEPISKDSNELCASVIEVFPSIEECFVVTKEASPETESSQDQFQDGTLLAQAVSRDHNETKLSSSETEVCSSISEKIPIREGLGSTDHADVFPGEGLHAENNMSTFTSELEEHQEYTPDEKDGNNIYDSSLIETSKPQRDDSEVNAMYMEPVHIAEEQFGAEEQLGVPNRSSLVVEPITDQLQEESLLHTVSKESVEEMYETEESASVVDICTSIVHDVPINESLASEELSGTIQDTHFEAQSESLNGTSMLDIQDDYRHEVFQSETSKSQEDGRYDFGHIEAGFLTEEQFVVIDKSGQGDSNNQMHEDRLQQEHTDEKHVEGYKDSLTEATKFEVDESAVKTGQVEVEHVPQEQFVEAETFEMYNIDYQKKETFTSDHIAEAGQLVIGEIDKISPEMFQTSSVTEICTSVIEDVQIKDNLVSEEHREVFTEVSLRNQESITSTCEEEEPQEHKEVELLPTEQLVVELSLRDEGGDYTEEKRDPTKDTNNTYLNDNEQYRPQDHLKLEQESCHQVDYHPDIDALSDVHYNITGHALESTMDQDKSPSHENVDLYPEINSLIPSSSFDQNVKVSSDGPDAQLEIQNVQSLMLPIAKESGEEMDNESHNVTKISGFDVEKVTTSHEELDVLSETQCVLSPDHTVCTLPEIMGDLDSTNKLMISPEDQSGAYSKDQTPEEIKDLEGPSESYLEGYPDVNYNLDLLSEIQCVLSPVHTAQTFSKLMDDLDSIEKVIEPPEDHTGACTEEQASEKSKDLEDPSESHLEGHPDVKDSVDLLSEIQCMLSQDQTAHKLHENADILDSTEKVTILPEDQSGTYTEDQAPEIIKDLDVPSESHLDGHIDVRDDLDLSGKATVSPEHHSGSYTEEQAPEKTKEFDGPSQSHLEGHLDIKDNFDLLSEIQCVLSPVQTSRGFPEIMDDLDSIERVTEPPEDHFGAYAEEQIPEKTKDIDVPFESNVEGLDVENNLDLLSDHTLHVLPEIINDLDPSGKVTIFLKDQSGAYTEEQAPEKTSDLNVPFESKLEGGPDVIDNLDLFSETQCVLSPGHTENRFSEIMETLDSTERVTEPSPSEDHLGAYIEEKTSEKTKDPNDQSNSHLEGQSDVKDSLNPLSDYTLYGLPKEIDDLDQSVKLTVSPKDHSGAFSEERAQERTEHLDGPSESRLQGHPDFTNSNYKTGKDLMLEIHTVMDTKFETSIRLGVSDVRAEGSEYGAEAEHHLTLGHSEDETEKYIILQTSRENKQVDNECHVTSTETPRINHGQVNQKGSPSQGVLEEVMNLDVKTSAEPDISFASELYGQETDIKSLTEASHIQQEVDIVHEVQPSTDEEITINLHKVEHSNTEHEEPLPTIQTTCLEKIDKDQEQTLVDGSGMSTQQAVQEEEDIFSKVPFHSTLDVSAQKSRILLLRKTSVRRRPGQRPVTLQEDLPDPTPPVDSPLKIRVAVFPEKMPTVSSVVPPGPESSYPTEEATETILRRKSSIRRRQRPATYQEDLTEPSLPEITSSESTLPAEEPSDDNIMSEHKLDRKSSIRRPWMQPPVAFEDKLVEPPPPMITPIKMGVPNFLGGRAQPSAVATVPESSHHAEEPKDEGTTSETMLRRKSSVRRPKGKQTVTSEEQTVEPPPPQATFAPMRMGVPLFPGVPAHVTQAPASSQPTEEPGEEQLTIKPKKGFLKHAGFGGAHPGMMQELQARLHKKKPKE